MGLQATSSAGTPTRITASTLIKTGGGRLRGIFVSAASATPTIKVWNSTTNSGDVLVNTFTPAGPAFYEMPFQFGVGCYVEISGTVDCTVSYFPG
jgi:hypothetical protein